MTAYEDHFIIEDPVALAELALTGKTLERVREDATGLHVHFTDGHVLDVRAEGVLQVEVRHAHEG
jgi:hypothetical protein